MICKNQLYTIISKFISVYWIIIIYCRIFNNCSWQFFTWLQLVDSYFSVIFGIFYIWLTSSFWINTIDKDSYLICTPIITSRCTNNFWIRIYIKYLCIFTSFRIEFSKLAHTIKVITSVIWFAIFNINIMFIYCITYFNRYFFFRWIIRNFCLVNISKTLHRYYYISLIVDVFVKSIFDSASVNSYTISNNFSINFDWIFIFVVWFDSL